jgi:hypothetical protein
MFKAEFCKKSTPEGESILTEEKEYSLEIRLTDIEHERTRNQNVHSQRTGGMQAAKS